MSRLGGLFGGDASKGSSAAGSSASLNGSEEEAVLQDALDAGRHIMNDDIEKANTMLDKGDSTFHKLGRAITCFMQVVMGWEQGARKEATDRLQAAETLALAEERKSQKDSKAWRSAVYPPGAEYRLAYAQATIMSAVVALISESLTESLKGFYRVRKAFLALEDIAKADNIDTEDDLILQEWDKDDDGVDQEQHAEIDEVTSPGPQEFFDAPESPSEAIAANGDVGNTLDKEVQDTAEAVNKLSVKNDNITFREVKPPQPKPPYTNPIDNFIHSGTHVNYGILLLIISLIPPAFGRILSLLSFRGDREAGLRHLWVAATRHTNVNAAIAALALLAFYNEMLTYFDIAPEDSYPQRRLQKLLALMRQEYPESRLLLLQESLMCAAERRLPESVHVLDTARTSGEKSQIKQVEALFSFQSMLKQMYLHRYADSAESGERSTTLNAWSHALYWYIAGCCHVELYRIYKYGGTLPKHYDTNSDPNALNPDHIEPNAEEAEKHKTKAMELFDKCPSVAKRKLLIAKPLPFEVYLTRKLNKWRARAKEGSIDVIDAVGVSPIEEMMYFWGGYARMARPQIEDSLRRLAFSDGGVGNTLLGPEKVAEFGGKDPHWSTRSEDEDVSLAFLRGVLYRQLGDITLSREMLQKGVSKMSWEQLKASGPSTGLADSWPLPCGKYEIANTYWLEAVAAVGEHKGMDERLKQEYQTGGKVKDALSECGKLLNEVSKWEWFDLDVRVGIKVTTGKDTLKKLGVLSG